MGLLKWLYRDDKIDDLIAQNTIRYRPGMRTVDIETLRRLGTDNREESYRADARSETKAVTS